MYYGSYRTLKVDKQSSYSCSKAHLPKITGVSERFQHYFGVLNCPTRCYAKCGDTYHCCVAPPPPPKENCFPFSARVALESGKSVTMSELQIGDRVQTSKYTGKLFCKKLGQMYHDTKCLHVATNNYTKFVENWS